METQGVGAMEYIAYLHKDKNSDYGVSFPDFPGCVTAGKTLEEARKLAVEALTLHMAGVVEGGGGLAGASTLDQRAKRPGMKGAVGVLGGGEAPGEEGPGDHTGGPHPRQVIE